jgi:hypothetical protein
VTETKEQPFLIKKILTDKKPKFFIAGLCLKCDNEKSRVINMRLPDMFYKIPDKQVFFNSMLVDNKRVPIIANLPGLVLK